MKPSLPYVVLLWLFAIAITPMIAKAEEELAQRKNVVILLADDLGWGDVGFNGGNADTPNIDQLAAEGVRLNRFYAYPACSPARAALLTGRFPERYGISGPVRPRDPGLSASERLLPADFQQAGYRTSLIGKWHLGQTTQPEAHPTRRGFDQFYGFIGEAVDYDKHTNMFDQVDWQRDGKTINEQGYVTDLLTNEAVAQINAQDRRKPFCMVVSFSAPHNPFQAPENLIAKYRDRMSEREATYAAMMDSLDQGVGRILAAIDKQKLRDETIVVFTSDNGAVRIGKNTPLRGHKREVYEGGIHVPCIVRVPGVLKPGTHSDQLTAIHDLFPTLAQAVGVSIQMAKPSDGVSVWNSLVNGTNDPRCIVVAENDYALIQNDWKLISSSGAESELYNLADDASETKNLADTHAEVVRMLTRELLSFRSAVSQDVPFVSEVAKTLVSERGEAKVLTASPAAGSLQEGESLAAAKLLGDVKYGLLGDRRTESNGRGLQLTSGEDVNGDGLFAGEASLRQTVEDPKQRWYRLQISGLAQDKFAVDQDDLYLKVRFFKDGGADSLDLIKTRIYEQVQRERSDFFDKDTNKSLGHSVWRTYAMDFRTPFPEVDTLELAVGFANGKGNGANADFWVQSMQVEPIDVPDSYQPPKTARVDFPQPDQGKLVALGGRWYFDLQGGGGLPKQFDYTNADQLLYKADRFEAPFAGNMSSWLRAGYLDFNGDEVTEDKYKPYAVIITVTDKHIVIRSRNLPNHPTATFPDKWRLLDGNPSYIRNKPIRTTFHWCRRRTRTRLRWMQKTPTKRYRWGRSESQPTA